MTTTKDRIAETCPDSKGSEGSVCPNGTSKPQLAPTAGDRAEEDGRKPGEDDGDECRFLIATIGLLSAGIGNTRSNSWLGYVGLVLWVVSNIIHFGLDFYEAKFVFHVSWASTVALFLIGLFLCSVNAIKYSIPWFIKAVRQLSKHGKYPKTMKRLCTYFKAIRLLIIPLSVAAAMGQFGCYAYDDALDLNFNDKLSTNHSGAGNIRVPEKVMIIVNVLRATSLVHIFYGFLFFLLTNLGTTYMIQCSMEEYVDFMAKVLRETPITISFSEAVNSFAVRCRFVNRGSSNTSGVFTVLLVVCSTSFVLNAYNYLFLKKFAIYIWFALVPIILAVMPLIGAAWVTRHYQRYKLVVVNAWVDVHDDDDDHDDEEDDVTRHSPPRRSRENTGISTPDKRPSLEKSTTLENNVNKKQCSDTNGNIKSGGISATQSFSRSRSPSSVALDIKERINRGSEIRKSRSLIDLSSAADPTSIPNGRGGISLSQPDNTPRANGVRSFPDFHVLDPTGLAKTDDYNYENRAYLENEEQITVKNRITFENPEIEVTDLSEETDSGDGRTPSAGSDPARPETSRSQASQVFSGIAKTYSRWRVRVKANRKFNFEKYITYLDNTLPNIGFSIGGVVITWDAVSGFCLLLFTLVSVFAQEAFFGR